MPESHLQSFTVESRIGPFRQSLASGAEQTYVAECDGQVVGFLTVGDCRDADVDTQTTGEIWGIYLSPDYWRKGIGTSLSRYGEGLLRSRGRAVATLWVLEANDQARRFYEAMGFAPDGVTRQVDLGSPLTAIRYRKDLRTTEPAVRGEG
ncbi:GNAT family N-acetyltransferase [Candidatus Latescibacterota bacterium]